MLPLPSSGQAHFTVAFSPCGRWLAAGGSEYAVDLWDLQAPHEPARRLQNQGGPILRTAFAPTGRLVAVSTQWIQTFDPVTPTMYTARRVITVRRAAIAPDARTYVLCNPILSQQGLDISDHWLDWSQDDLPGEVLDVAVMGDGRVLTARVWPAGGGLLDVRNRKRGECLDSMPVTGRPHRVACSADGALAATIANGNMSVWNLTARKAVADRAQATHGGWLSVAFDPHGRRVVTGGIDGTVAVWGAATDAPPFTTFQWCVGPVYAVAFDADGLRAAAAGHAGAIVWDADE